MKSRNIAIFLCLSVLLSTGVYPLLAQQAFPQWPGGTSGLFGDRTPTGQMLSPYTMGLQPPPLMGVPGLPNSSGSKPGSSDLSQISRKQCGLVSIPQLPSPPPYSNDSSSPRTLEVQSPWPGSPVGQEARSFQAAGLHVGSQQRPFDQSRPQVGLSNQPAQSPSQVPGSTFAPQAPYEPFSSIEAAYQVPTFPGEGPRELRQYGYSLFAGPISTFAPVEDVPVGPDYILGPGDDLSINVWGAMESAVVRTVDRNGQIILPSVGPVQVWGLAFSQAERLIREQLSRYYRGFQASVTMGRLRTIRVYVVGEVCQPGSFTLSSLSTVTNAIFAAGGSLKLGSLRNIQLKRNHHVVGTIDIYDFLLRGDKTRDFRLESGDTIFVPPIGQIAAIEGEIKRPAIYELKEPTRVSDLIEIAGGLTPQSYLKRVQVIRSKLNAEREVIDLDLTDFGGNGDSPRDIEIKNGDLVRIYPTDPRIYNTVRLAGALKHSGEYELKPGMRLTEVLRRENLLPEAYPDKIEIARIKDDLTTEILSVDIKKAWEGDKDQDIPLQRLDLISVRSEFKAPGSIKLEEEIMRPGIYRFKPGERLSSLLRRAGGFTDKAFLRGAVFTRASVREVEQKRLEELVRSYEQQLLVADQSLIALASTGSNKDETGIQQAILVQRRKQVHSLSSKVTLGRIVVHLDEPDKLEGSPSDLVLEDGDSLKIPQMPATVLVTGSVRNPTAALHKEDMDVQYYLNRAGGVTNDADENGIHILKADGSAIAGFVRLRNIEPGDVVVVPPSTETKAWVPYLRDLMTIAGQVAVGLAGVKSIFFK